MITWEADRQVKRAATSPAVNHTSIRLVPLLEIFP